jgi:hypothetical protein
MFLRSKNRFKDGKQHRYWSIVENRRVADGRVVQHQVLYLGEINDSQKASWCKAIEVLDEDEGAPTQVALFPEDRTAPTLDCDVVQVRLSGLQLHRPRQWSAYWLACELWGQLRLDAFWQPHLPPSRKGTRWLNVLKTLVAYRLIDPGSEWRLHRDWFDRSAMGDLLGEDFAIAQSQTLYRCLDKLLAHNKALFSSLQERWRMLFDVRFDVLLYDLTSTYFESEPPEYGKRKYGYSRDKRPDCVQVVIALIVTPEGFPLAYEVLPGNTSDKTTLEDFLAKIEQQYGKAERIWIMDRGIPTEDSLAAMRGADTPVRYLVGTPKGRLSKLEKAFLTKPWAQVRERVDVKLLEQESEVYILARSHGRMHKERAMRRRRLKLVPTPRRVATHDALARRAPTQARCGQEGGRTRLRFARDPTARPRRTDQCKDLHLRHQSQETSPSASSRGPVPPALQPLWRGPRQAMGVFYPTHRGRTGVQRAQERSEHPPHLPSAR